MATHQNHLGKVLTWLPPRPEGRDRLKITRVEVYPVTISYPEAYVMASSSTAARDEVIIKVHTDQGVVGLGEAVDNALYDIMGKAFGAPVYQLLGGAARKTISVTRSLPIKSPGERAERAVALKERGYHTLTIKIGFDPNEDIGRLMAVKRAVGKWPPLEVDPNEVYTADVAIQTLKPVQDLITCVEQPVSRYDFLGMAKVTAALDTPVAADQILTSARNVALAAHLGAADIMCMKLPEMGGNCLGPQVPGGGLGLQPPCHHGLGAPPGRRHRRASSLRRRHGVGASAHRLWQPVGTFPQGHCHRARADKERRGYRVRQTGSGNGA